MWVRQDALKDGYDVGFFKTVEELLTNEWPLINPAYQGRYINWEKWEKLDSGITL